MDLTRRAFCLNSAAALAISGHATGPAAPPDKPLTVTKRLLDPEAQLRRWSFWTNRDWDWYTANIPFWESPDSRIDEIFYYRAEVLSKHLRYCSPETGYIFTEFSCAETLSWAGRYNAIASAADLHMEEVRWLKTRQYAEDYARYWMRTEGAQPRNYGFAVAWATFQMGLVHGDQHVAEALVPQYAGNFAGWEQGVVAYPHDNGFDPQRGLFWNTGRDVGGEFNLASCQLSESLRGIPGYKIRGGAGYRPDINALLFGEAQTIAQLARRTGHAELAQRFAAKAAGLRQRTEQDLWDPGREFFLHRWRYDEYSEGDTAGHKSIRQGSLIWDTNSDRDGGVGYQPQQRGAGRGREITGYIPWRYGLPADEERFAAAWKFLSSPDYFYAAYGPTTAERHDPWFHVVWHACRHNGQSWPFHTSRILSAGSRLLTEYKHSGGFTQRQWFDMFSIYARTQYENGRPHLAEAHSPFEPVWVQNEWPGLDYFHSSYLDHVVTGLAGLRPADDDTAVVVHPLAPADWDYFALDAVAYRGHVLSIVWDRNGERYRLGKGLTVLVDGQPAASSPDLRRLTVPLRPVRPGSVPSTPREVVLSANCEQAAFPKATASFTAKYDSPEAALDGLYWYDHEYGDKWTCRGSWTGEDWFQVDFGKPQTVAAVRLFLYADDREVASPTSYTLLHDQAGSWTPVVPTSIVPATPTAGRANTIRFAPLTTARLRVTFRHPPGIGVGLAQFQALAPVESPASPSAGA